MNSDDLVLFLRAAKAGSLTKASMETATSQPALSRRISALEQELGARLFHRSGRGLELTQIGQDLLQHAMAVDRILEEAAADMALKVRGGPSRVVVAAQPSIARMLFGPISKNLIKDYPGIRISLREGLEGQVNSWLADGSIDLAVIYLTEAQRHLESDTVIRERLSFVAPKSFDLPNGPFPIERLPDVPLVLPGPTHGQRILAEELCARSGRLPRISIECDASSNVVKQLVIEECGCALLPLASVAAELRQGLLQAVPLGNPNVMRDIAIATSLNRPPLVARREVAQAFRLEIRRLVSDGLWLDAAMP
ncbi:LysR family transcriptional regulator [Bordetella sp. BOR01]|uniref:LysR family transcriptional regulator n=1 Tax=Bordetella sp. BOR01 TaxID=2854779 RepID=UPI001C461AAF|nr:LysR family transcriptional regulator [Bordetella sp. BOR01]MBV7484384.1 LysR family transcriptional regulator [Bordetella sp. BOR01]